MDKVAKMHDYYYAEKLNETLNKLLGVVMSSFTQTTSLIMFDYLG